MRKENKMILASNWETYDKLHQKGIDSILWEDCYEKDDLIHLHNSFKRFCDDWYKDKTDIDVSIHDGMSIGKAISYMLYYDLETWIRVFYLFEHIASNGIDCIFYALNRDYFPDRIYLFFDRLNATYGPFLKTEFLQGSDNGLEFSVNRILNFNRNLSQPKRCRFSNTISLMESTRNIFRSSINENIRCYVLGLRNSSEYLKSLFNNNGLKHKIRLYFDTHYSGPKLLIKAICYNNISIIDEAFDSLAVEEGCVLSLTDKILETADIHLDSLTFLELISRGSFKTIFIKYIKNAIRIQLSRYLYLSKIIQKYKINATICEGHDTPESYYCKHLMDKYGGNSYFLPHGLVGKDKINYKYRELLAHYYFCYSKSEKLTWLNNYDIHDEDIIPIRFLKLVPSSFPLPLGERARVRGHFKFLNIKNRKKRCLNNKKPSATNLLILLDNFQVSLVSRINYFKSFRELYNLLKSLGFVKIDIRLHPAFFNYYPDKKPGKELKDRYFFSLPIQTPFKTPLKDVISKYDIIIGPLTTCIYEAICNGVFYIPYIPDFFPAETIGKIVDFQWLPGLFPQPCTNLKEIKDVLIDYIDSPSVMYNRFFESVESVNVYEHGEMWFWRHIISRLTVDSDKKRIITV